MMFERHMETAWAAGLFEGEGCIRLSTDKKYGRLAISSTDYDVLERFANWAGCGTIYSRSPNRNPLSKKTIYVWEAARTVHIVPILIEMLPYMGQRRLGKFEEVLNVVGGDQWW